MLWRKNSIAQEILLCEKPSEVKRLAYSLFGIKEDTWRPLQHSIMRKGLILKWEQNSIVRHELNSTLNKKMWKRALETKIGASV